jgi:hypothetical protein
MPATALCRRRQQSPAILTRLRLQPSYQFPRVLAGTVSWSESTRARGKLGDRRQRGAARDPIKTCEVEQPISACFHLPTRARRRRHQCCPQHQGTFSTSAPLRDFIRSQARQPPPLYARSKVASLRLDASRLDDGPPFFDFGFLIDAERLRCLLLARKNLLS